MIGLEKVESEKSKKMCEQETCSNTHNGLTVGRTHIMTIIFCKYHNNVTNINVLQKSQSKNSSHWNTFI